MYKPTAFNLAYMKREYHTVHMATQKRQHSEIACGTRHANVCSDNFREVNCMRCYKTDVFHHAKIKYDQVHTLKY